MEAYLERQLHCLLKSVRPANRDAMARARRQWNKIAKPLYGLGVLEEQIVKIAGIWGRKDVQTKRRAVAVFCADNGIVEAGVSQTDQSVTAAVTENLARGLASVNRMAAVAGADVLPVDMGVAGELREAGIQNCKIARGTQNFLHGPAMEQEQALEAIHAGIALAGQLKEAGYQILAAGEMGIGNTTTSSALASVLLGVPPETVTGRGAGLSDEALRHKLEVIRSGIARYDVDPARPLPLLAALGGFDIAGITGFFLGGAIYQIPMVLDGLITAVAALLAQQMCPLVTDYLLASHIGREPACALALKKLGLKPVLCADLALGEGTGAVMLFPLLDMALEVYRASSTFADIQIDPYPDYRTENSGKSE